MKLKESIKVKSTIFIHLHCSKVLVDASKYQFFLYLYIVLEEHKDLPIKKYCQTNKI